MGRVFSDAGPTLVDPGDAGVLSTVVLSQITTPSLRIVKFIYTSTVILQHSLYGYTITRTDISSVQGSWLQLGTSNKYDTVLENCLFKLGFTNTGNFTMSETSLALA